MKSELTHLKIFLPALLHLLFPCSSYAQDTITRYWIGTTPTNVRSKAKTEAKYFEKDGLWHMESRFLSNGKLYLTGTYLEPMAKTKTGEFRWYHENGRLAEVNRFVNNKADGIVLAWHDNGVLKDSLSYRAGYKVGKGFSWNEKGHLIGFYDLDDLGNGQVKTYRDKDSLYSQGAYAGGFKHGKWQYYAPEGYLEWEVDYLKDSIVGTRCFDSAGLAKNDCIFERVAIPVGGLSGWKKFLEKMLTGANYPSRKLMKKEKNLSGEVWVRFLVDKNGNVTEPEIVKSLNEEADGIVLRAMLNAPKWLPGVIKNKLVRSYHTQPVTFVVEAR